MPRPRYERAAPELKSAILGAARKEFARAGYEAASLNRILEDAGLSKGAFYYYFDDKADLAATVLLDMYRPATTVMDSFANPTNAEEFWAGAKRINRVQLDAMEASRESMDVLSGMAKALTTHRELGEKILPAFNHFVTAFLQFLRKGQELGVVRKDMTPELILAVATGIKEAMGRSLFPPQGQLSPEDLERFATLMWDLFERLIRAEVR